MISISINLDVRFVIYSKRDVGELRGVVVFFVNLMWNDRGKSFLDGSGGNWPKTMIDLHAIVCISNSM